MGLLESGLTALCSPLGDAALVFKMACALLKGLRIIYCLCAQL